VGQTRQRCWKLDWVIDLDIKGFFDNIDHDLLMRAVKKHAKEKWVVLYIERWLQAPAQAEDGHVTARGKGTPQGGVVRELKIITYPRQLVGGSPDRRYLQTTFPRATVA